MKTVDEIKAEYPGSILDLHDEVSRFAKESRERWIQENPEHYQKIREQVEIGLSYRQNRADHQLRIEEEINRTIAWIHIEKQRQEFWRRENPERYQDVKYKVVQNLKLKIEDEMAEDDREEMKEMLLPVSEGKSWEAMEKENAHWSEENYQSVTEIFDDELAREIGYEMNEIEDYELDIRDFDEDYEIDMINRAGHEMVEEQLAARAEQPSQQEEEKERLREEIRDQQDRYQRELAVQEHLNSNPEVPFQERWKQVERTIAEHGELTRLELQLAEIDPEFLAQKEAEAERERAEQVDSFDSRFPALAEALTRAQEANRDLQLEIDRTLENEMER